MSPDVSITGDEIENNAILIDEQDGFLAVTHVPSGTRLLVDENTDLSDLWDAFDDNIETSQFWQDDDGIAELLSQYDGIRFPHGEAESFSTEEITIGNTRSNMVFEALDDSQIDTDPDGNAEIEITDIDLSDSEILHMKLNYNEGGSDPHEVRFNGIDDSNYEYVDQSGDNITNDDSIQLLNPTTDNSGGGFEMFFYQSIRIYGRFNLAPFRMDSNPSDRPRAETGTLNDSGEDTLQSLQFILGKSPSINRLYVGKRRRV